MKHLYPLYTTALLSVASLCALQVPEEQKEHFNQVMQVHLDAIAFAEQNPRFFPDFDASKGVSAWWRQLELDGGVEALLHDETIFALAQELYAIAKADPRYQRAVTRLEEAEQQDDNEALEVARFQVQVQFVHALRMEIKRRGCLLRRPDDRVKTDDLKPAQGGSFVAADEQSWGKVLYVAKTMAKNAYIDHVKDDLILKAYALAQVLFKIAE